MRNVVSEYVNQIRQDRRKQMKLFAVLAALAVIVAGVVFWQLHNTGVAMTNEVFCGQEEHVHDDSCYEQVLVCGLGESGPVEGHVHTDACYETVEALVCQDGSSGHVHTEECYVTERNLVCGLEESEGTEGHVHSDACYETVLTCGIPEHTHTIDCMVDEEADVETADDWEATLPEELSGVWAQDVVSIAESQIGYTESERNFQLADDGETRQGYSRYGAWYGNEYGDWDAMFASFCLNYAGVPEEEFPESSGAYAWETELGTSGLYVPADQFTPQAGDLAFFDLDEDGEADSVGVISYLSSKDIYVIEGNYEDAVTEQTYDLDDDQIIGYGILPEQPGVEEQPVSLIQQTLEATIYSDASCVKTLSAAESITLSGMMPENASVLAYPVDVTIGDMTILAAYDITIYDEHGHEFEPEDGTIQVSISNSEIRSALGNDEEPVVYHINDRTDVLEKVSGCSTTRDMIEFTADSFSVYIVGNEDIYVDADTGDEYTVYTVEFYRYEFDAEDPDAVKLDLTQYVLPVSYLNQPGAQEYKHHTFIGWYTEKQTNADAISGEKYDFSKTLQENFDEWAWDEDNHTVKLYTAYNPVYYVYYMLNDTVWNTSEKPAENVEWYDFYTEEYRFDDTLDTRSADILIARELGGTMAATGWYSEEPEYDPATGEFKWDESSKIDSSTKVEDDLKLYPKIDNVVWVYFTLRAEEGENTEAAEPVFIVLTDGENTEIGDILEDVEVSRPGYELVRWDALKNENGSTEPNDWTWKENVVSTDKVGDLLKEGENYIDLYAVWDPQEVGYTVNIWRQKATDGQLGLDQKVVQEGETYDEYIQYYDYAESYTISAADSELVTGTKPNNSILNDYNHFGEIVYQGDSGDRPYNGFEYNQERTENNLETKTMAGDGSTVINVFYDRVTITWNFYNTTSSPTSSSRLYGSLIGLYGTNITPTNGSNPAGTWSSWTPYTNGNTSQNWVCAGDEGTVTTIFETEYVFKRSETTDDNGNVTTSATEVDFWRGSSSADRYIVYYLEVTNDSQVDENSSAASQARAAGVPYTREINDITYVFDRAIQLTSTNSSSTYYLNNKFIGYNLAQRCTVTRNTSNPDDAAYGELTEVTIGEGIGLGNDYCIYCDAIEYNLYLYSNHDGEQLIDSYTFKYGADLSSVELPTDLDAEEYGPAYYYKFVGTWCVDPTFTAEFIIPDTMPANNLAAYAEWELKDITVTFISYVDSNLYELLVGIYGEDNVTTNSNGDGGEWSYSITLKATDTLDYRLDSGLEAVKEKDDDLDIYSFNAWWNVGENKVFSFQTTLYDDITLEAKWHEEDIFYQIIYNMNLEGYNLEEGGGYRLGTLHTRNGEAEVRQVDYEFNGGIFDTSKYSADKFICWEDDDGNRYYPGEYVEWSNVSDKLLVTENDEDDHYYYILHPVWAEDDESVLHLYYNYPGSSNEYSDVTITTKSLDPINLGVDYTDGDGNTYDIPHAGDTYTDPDTGLTYHFAGWSTTEPAGTSKLADVNVPYDVSVAVNTIYDDESNELMNNLYGIWLADKTFTIVKEDTSGNGLIDAEFTLSYTYTLEEETYLYYYDETNGWIEWVAGDEENVPTITLGRIQYAEDYTDGIGLFDYDGTFTLTEINAPEGYQELANAIIFTLNESDSSVEITQNVTSSNDPTRDLASASGTTLTVQNEGYTFPVYIFKYSGEYVSEPLAQILDDNDDAPSYTALEGAEFILSRTVTSGDGTDTVYAEFDWTVENGFNVYELTGWTEDISEATTLTSDGQGYIEIQNLEAGSYTLTETKAPDGYMLLDEDIVFTVNSDGSVTVVSGNAVKDEYNNNYIAVGNEAGSELPYTGGIGTWIYTAAGVLLIGGAASLLVYRKRRAA